MVTAIIPAKRVDKALDFIAAQEAQLALMQSKLADLKKVVERYKIAKSDTAFTQDEFLRFSISYRLDKYLAETTNLLAQLEIL